MVECAVNLADDLERTIALSDEKAASRAYDAHVTLWRGEHGGEVHVSLLGHHWKGSVPKVFGLVSGDL